VQIVCTHVYYCILLKALVNFHARYIFDYFMFEFNMSLISQLTNDCKRISFLLRRLHYLIYFYDARSHNRLHDEDYQHAIFSLAKGRVLLCRKEVNSLVSSIALKMESSSIIVHMAKTLGKIDKSGPWTNYGNWAILSCNFWKKS